MARTSRRARQATGGPIMARPKQSRKGSRRKRRNEKIEAGGLRIVLTRGMIAPANAGKPPAERPEPMTTETVSFQSKLAGKTSSEVAEIIRRMVGSLVRAEHRATSFMHSQQHAHREAAKAGKGTGTCGLDAAGWERVAAFMSRDAWRLGRVASELRVSIDGAVFALADRAGRAS